MRNLQQRPLLVSPASLICIITLAALLLLDAPLPLARADGPMSSEACSRPPLVPPCRQFHNSAAFPFYVTSGECRPASSFDIVGCSASASSDAPTWPYFVNATKPKLPPPTVWDFSSNNSILLQDTSSDIPKVVGFINLTWNASLTRQKACQSPVPLNEIFNYTPHYISLAQFAHSIFEFASSNIILFFNCDSSSPASAEMRNNSTDCNSYAHSCASREYRSPKCYQYTPTNQELNLSEAIRLHCKKAMFFVRPRTGLSSSALKWSPGLIQLNWSGIHNPWLNETMRSCRGCLQKSNRVCGYNLSDDFVCQCTGGRDCEAATLSKGSDGSPHKTITIAIGIGAAAGGFAIALSLGLTLFCIWKRKVYMKFSAPSSPHNSKSWIKKPSFLWRKQDPVFAKEMSYEEIMHATECFAEKHMLGDGGFGTVYKGVLADGRKVAVKRLYHDNYKRMEHFINEIKVLSNLNHPNLVKLYGFSYEDEKELLLVFEYAPQGTVSDQLHNDSKPPMSWKLRLDIACETAEALSYLHNSVSPPIYHRDVKTTNILLDEGFHAKLADFGLSKLVPLKVTHVSTAPLGTPGYLDPQYYHCYQLTDKSDVYSLGVVLMELVSAKLAVDMSRERGEINLSMLAVTKIQCGKLEELVDPRLEMKKIPSVERSINRVVEVAFRCLNAERDDRPSMSSVVETLAKIRRDYADDDVEANPNIRIDTTIGESCVSDGLNRPLECTVESPCSVFFSSGSSNHSSNMSNG